MNNSDINEIISRTNKYNKEFDKKHIIIDMLKVALNNLPLNNLPRNKKIKIYEDFGNDTTTMFKYHIIFYKNINDIDKNNINKYQYISNIYNALNAINSDEIFINYFDLNLNKFNDLLITVSIVDNNIDNIDNEFNTKINTIDTITNEFINEQRINEHRLVNSIKDEIMNLVINLNSVTTLNDKTIVSDEKTLNALKHINNIFKTKSISPEEITKKYKEEIDEFNNLVNKSIEERKQKDIERLTKKDDSLTDLINKYKEDVVIVGESKTVDTINFQQCSHLKVKDEYSKSKNTLKDLYNLQKDIQENVYGYNFEKMREMDLLSFRQFFDWNYHAIQDELRELFDALGGIKDGVGNAVWKPWKKDHTKKAPDMKFCDMSPTDLKELKMELIDIQHFVFNMMLAVGMTDDELFNYYFAKNEENRNRQKNNY